MNGHRIDGMKRDLSNREREICCLIKDGLSDAEIAGSLFISLHTVRSHTKSVHQKLEVQTRGKLVALLNKAGRICPAI